MRLGPTLRCALLCVLLGAVLHAGALAADPQPYTARLKKTGDGALDAALTGSSGLIALQKTQAVGPFALAGRIRADYARLRTALESFGFYEGSVTITAAGLDGQAPQLPDRLAALPKGDKAAIVLSVQRGALFHFGTIRLDDPETQAAGSGALSAGEMRAFGLQSGQPAAAAEALAAQGRLLSALREDGHALATVDAPLAYLRPATRTLDLVYKVHQGPRVDIGPIRLAGLGRVSPRFIRRRLLVHTGQLYQPSAIEAARQDLASVGVFSDVRVSIPDALDPAGQIPIDFQFAGAKRHTVSAQVGYSTDLGGSAGATWTHHNLFGSAEELQLAALATGLGGTATRNLGYDVYANFTKPDYYHRNQNLILRVEGLRQDLQAYSQTALLVRGSLSRRLGKRWTLEAGVGAEQEQIVQEGSTRSYTLVSLPLSTAYDSTDLANPLDAPTHGVRASVGATPTYSLTRGGAFFTILQGQASTYLDLARLNLTRPGHSVIAVRGTVGSVQGASVFQLPPDQRLYAGGSSTVRGYKYQGVGPLFADGYPVGGLSLDAATLEFRQRVFGKFGAVAFVDAGQVSEQSTPFQGTLRVGAGLGARYFTPIGPIRLDVAVPLNKPPGGDSFELYIGLGETF